MTKVEAQVTLKAFTGAEHFLGFSQRGQLLPALKDCSVPAAERRGDGRIKTCPLGSGHKLQSLTTGSGPREKGLPDAIGIPGFHGIEELLHHGQHGGLVRGRPDRVSIGQREEHGSDYNIRDLTPGSAPLLPLLEEWFRPDTDRRRNGKT